MKHNDLSNTLLDAGDFNDAPSPTNLYICWFLAACFGALSVICTIIATQPVGNLMP